MDQFIYQKLVESEQLGFIDPFEDLGTFDSALMKFVEPVERLVNRYSGKPYNPYWQAKIKEMRAIYIEYLESSQTHNEQLDYRLRNNEAKKHADEIVKTYLKLGFRFKEIEGKVKLPPKRLRRNWRRSDYVETANPCFYLKSNLAKGNNYPKRTLPNSLALTIKEKVENDKPI